VILEESSDLDQGLGDGRADLLVPCFGGWRTGVGEAAGVPPCQEAEALVCVLCLEDEVVAAEIAPSLNNVEALDAG
jgi:hypothetical protein